MTAPRPPSVIHAFASAAAQTTDPTKVGTDKWNAPHTLDLGSVCQALAALNITGNQLPYFTDPNTADLATVTAFALQLLAATDAAGARLVTGAVAKAGDTMAGNLDFAGLYSATGLRAPALPTDAANKAYVDALATLVSGALVFKGSWDASAGTFPGGGAAQTGWFYKVSVAGTVGGQSFSVGDDVYAIANNASTTVYANNWLVIQGTITLAEIQAAVGFTFGTAAALNAGTGPNNLVQLDGTGKMPALDASNMTATTRAPNDNATHLATTAYADAAAASISASSAHGRCFLKLSAGSLLLLPKNGNKLVINGIQCTIPAAGLSKSAVGLTASTLYYIYATASGSNVNAIEASTTGHSTDATTGVEIKTGDATRTLVGQAYVIPGPAFADNATQRLVRSWFNDPGVVGYASATGVPLSSGALTNLTANPNFLAWANESIAVTAQFSGGNNVSGTNNFAAIGVDSTTVNSSVLAKFTQETAGNANALSAIYGGTVTEGLHFVAALGEVSSGTFTVDAGITVRTGGNA